MADLPPLTPQDYDPWHLATPLQLLTLLERLDVPMTEVARWLHVPKSSVSMWRHGTRAFPPKHLATLYEEARRTFDAEADLAHKAANLAPTAALREALRAEWGALWGRWKQEVLYDAGTHRRALLRQYEALGTLVHQEHFSAEDAETARLMGESLGRIIDMIRTLAPAVPSADDQWDARMTAAHEAAHPTPQDAEDQTQRRPG